MNQGSKSSERLDTLPVQPDWSASPLGLVAGWPEALRAAVDLIAGSRFPMFIVWGAERTLIYNHAYVPILGSHHPEAMGRPFFEIWPEVHDVIAPVIDQAYAGVSSLFEDLPVTLHRPHPEETWFTFSYSPLKDEDDSISGALCVCAETTPAMRARRRQSFLVELETTFRSFHDSLDIIRSAQQALGRHFGVSRVGYGTLDESGRYFTTRENWTDGSVPHHNGTHDLAGSEGPIFSALRSGDTLVVEDALEDPRTKDWQASDAFAALRVRSAVTVSLVKDGRIVAALYLHHRATRRWSAEEIALIEEVAERTWSAVERASAEERLRQIMRTQSFLLELGDRLRAIQGAEEIKRTAARLLGEHLGAGRVGYGEIDADERRVTVESDWSSGTMASLAGETRELDVFGSAIIAQLRAGQMLRLNDIGADPMSAPYAEGYASIGTRSLLVAPLIKSGRFTAILYLHQPTERAWTDEEADLVQEVAERTWAAVERAQAEAALKRLNETLEAQVEARTAELEQVHEALRQSQKLEAMGQLTGGVAHDFNNLLTPIIGSLDMLQRRGVVGEREARLVESALKSADKAKMLVHRLLAFARRQPLQPRAVDLGALARGMAGLIASTLGPRIKLEMTFEDGVPLALADPNQLEMALLNLSVNARDAMADGGTLTLSLAHRTIDSGDALAAGDYLLLSVADTGIGMDEDTRRRAIEPFFSTKPLGQGTGLGLSMVHGLASQLGGGIEIASKPGVGTRIDMWIPASSAEAVLQPGEADEAHDESCGNVLVVDDDDLVRTTTADMLVELGYHVTQVPSAEEGLERLRSGPAPDLLLTDHLMPGMTGSQLVAAARVLYPLLPVVIVSGYAEMESIAPDLPRLTKPFRQPELIAILREAMSKRENG